MNPRHISAKGIDFVKRWEGLRLNAYQCEAGVWTIGYGHTGADVHARVTITEEEAERLLRSDIQEFELCVNTSVQVPLTQAQFDALVSFSFNVGCAALHRSTLLKKLNKQNYVGAATEFGRWIYAGGHISAGLVNRRRAEAELFQSQT